MLVKEIPDILMDWMSVYANLYMVSERDCKFLKIPLLIVCFDMNTMYCILKGFLLYNFGNKFVFIVVVIVIETVINSSAWRSSRLLNLWEKYIYLPWNMISNALMLW